MKRDTFETLLDDLVNTVNQPSEHLAVRKKLLTTYTKLQREIDRLEEDLILQAYRSAKTAGFSSNDTEEDQILQAYR